MCKGLTFVDNFRGKIECKMLRKRTLESRNVREKGGV
jgi:hypothetical protein